MNRDEQGERSAEALKQTGIMEERSQLRKNLPSNGVRLLISLLTFYGLTCEYSLSLILSALTYFFELIKEVAMDLLAVSIVSSLCKTPKPASLRRAEMEMVCVLR